MLTGQSTNQLELKINKAKFLPIADVTEFLLNRLIDLNDNNQSFENADTYPMFTRKNNKRWIKWD